MTQLTFEASGKGPAVAGPMPLDQVQALALSCGFVKAGVAQDKPASLRADMGAFFKALGVNSLSSFKALFCSTVLSAPVPGQAPAPAASKEKKAVARPLPMSTNVRSNV